VIGLRYRTAKETHRRLPMQILIVSFIYVSCISVYALWHHARIAYQRPLTNVEMIEGGYFDKTNADGRMREENEALKQMVSQYVPPHGAAFFGPPVSYFYRSADLLPPTGLPLYFAPSESFRERDVSGMLRAFEQHHFCLVVFEDEWSPTLPLAMKYFIK